MARTWIKSLNERIPEGPVFSCPEIDNAIQSLKNIREINDDLRSSLETAAELIETLDDMVIELRAENDRLIAGGGE